MQLPRVAVIGTGGTISSLGRHSLDLVEYNDFGQLLHVDELLSRFPEIKQVADVQAVRFRAISSTAITPADGSSSTRLSTASPLGGTPGGPHHARHGDPGRDRLFSQFEPEGRLPRRARRRAATGKRAQLGRGHEPAQRGAGGRRASDPRARVLVLLNDEIQAAREVTKGSTFRVETFRSPDLGILGYADADGQVVLYRAPTRRHAPDTEFDTRGLASCRASTSPIPTPERTRRQSDALVAAGAEAIVCASMAPGLLTPAEREAAAATRKRGVLVIQSCRAGSGRVMARTRLREQGIVAADNLNPQKARVLAMLALTRSHDPQVIQRYFDEY